MPRTAPVALLIENEAPVAGDVAQALRAEGFDVVTATSCADAEAWLYLRRPDIAIVSMTLADGPCYSVATRLREERIPFLIHSGGPASGHKGTVFDHGFWVAESVPPSELAGRANAIVEVMNRHR